MLRYKEHIDALPATALDFGAGSFLLGHELSEIKQLCREERRVAAILHCGRILVPLASAAQRRLFGEPRTDLPTALRLLRDVSVLTPARAEQLTALHTLVRDAQTARRELHPADLDYALLLLRKLLLWFFSEFRLGMRLPADAMGAAQEMPIDGELAMIVERSEVIRGELDDVVSEYRSVLLRSPIGPGLLLQGYIGRLGRIDSRTVQQVRELTHAFPDDALLHQLFARALWWQGDRAGALIELDNAQRLSSAEPDVLRFLGDWHQDSWLRSERADEPALHRALQYYQLAWVHSHETDTRAGVEAAILGLSRGHRERSESIAQLVADSYHRRFRAMGEGFCFRDREDRLSLAHSALLLGEWQYARRRYNQALASAPHNFVLAVKRRLRLLLPLLGIEHSPTRFLVGVGPRRRRSSKQLTLPFHDTT